jgi:hypothetical protein
LATKTQAVKRARYDANQERKMQELEQIKKISLANKRREEEILLKKRRRDELVHRPLPMPRSEPPPQLKKSAKMLTIPKSPKLNTRVRATVRKSPSE